MPRHPNPLPASLGTAFLSSTARSSGATKGRLAAADLGHPHRGVRTRAQEARELDRPDDPTPDELACAAILARVRAHALVLPAHAFYIGDAARAVYGLPFADAAHAATADLEVAVLAPHRGVRRPAINAVQVRPSLAHCVMIDGIRVATPATVWAMSARGSDVRELVRLGDAIVRIPRGDRGRRQPERQLATPEQLQAAIDAGRRRGREKLRRALPLVRVGSMSVLETDWRWNLRGSGLPDPDLDFEVRDKEGALLGISDGAFPAYRLAVEVEGDGHRVSRRQWNRDIEKYAAYADLGWETVRLTSAHIRGPGHRDVDLVREALTRRGWRLSGAPDSVGAMAASAIAIPGQSVHRSSLHRLSTR